MDTNKEKLEVSRKKNIIENLKATNTDLRNILIDLKMENKECQFDYCTNLLENIK